MSQISRRSLKIAAFIALCLALAGAGVAGLFDGKTHAERPALGLFTTLPIYWGDAAQLSDLLAEDRQAHWARGALEQDHVLQPLDILAPGEKGSGLSRLHYLLMAQPRALSASENVALDGWVRGGGRLLLFADPMLTEESPFPLGDKRRPHDVALLSPILAHWGLQLQFDEQQQGGIHTVSAFGAQLPVELRGRFVADPAMAAGDAPCILLADGLAAQCSIGRGKALIIADAALLDSHALDRRARGAALAILTRQAFEAQ